MFAVVCSGFRERFKSPLALISATPILVRVVLPSVSTAYAMCVWSVTVLPAAAIKAAAERVFSSIGCFTGEFYGVAHQVVVDGGSCRDQGKGGLYCERQSQ